MNENFFIKEATAEDSEKIGEVFDLYRQFYKKISNKTLRNTKKPKSSKVEAD